MVEESEMRDERQPWRADIAERLIQEFTGVHTAQDVTSCVAAAHHGAEEVTGAAPPDLVERIARRHLQVLAMVAAERRQGSHLGNTP